ncbi:hypothetical protein DSM104443_04072 [Usitatibacter rugosus]|uniref:Uncharacterized protein n=1 Tax=Usitatibacter rugosus TaxID=2732067 RepID=A0A6M4H1G7_9PROT|nr:hypothetical protein [Usitatibacter rugosus]QJR12978.1 hypothetical protein DSM104443_04072 [Usitatibacter rugosus]
MDPTTLLKLALVPIAVGLASLAARKWGHTVSGYLGGMPMVGAPIIIFLAMDHGTVFAAKVALVTLAGLVAQAAHQIAMAYVGRRFGWIAGLLSGWGAFAIVGVGLAHLEYPWWVAASYGVAALLVMWRVLPRAKDDGALPAVPRIELALRMAAAFAIAAVILWGSTRFGPVVSGVLLSVPVTGSVIPPFTLKLYGPEALARVQRGFLTGLTGFASFFLVVGVALQPLGLAMGFGAATLAALTAVGIFSRFGKRNVVGDD